MSKPFGPENKPASSMIILDPKGVMNEIYQSSLALGVASILSVILHKFTKMSSGTPMSLKPFIMLSIALGLGDSILKVLSDKYKFPIEPFSGN